jgi:hypothetical protein
MHSGLACIRPVPWFVHRVMSRHRSLIRSRSSTPLARENRAGDLTVSFSETAPRLDRSGSSGRSFTYLNRAAMTPIARHALDTLLNKVGYVLLALGLCWFCGTPRENASDTFGRSSSIATHHAELAAKVSLLVQHGPSLLSPIAVEDEHWRAGNKLLPIEQMRASPALPTSYTQLVPPTLHVDLPLLWALGSATERHSERMYPPPRA